MECEDGEKLFIPDLSYHPETPRVWPPDHCEKVREILQPQTPLRTRLNPTNFHKKSRKFSFSRREACTHGCIRPHACKMNRQFPDITITDFSEQNTSFDKRKITTIPEEVFHYRKLKGSRICKAKPTTYKEKSDALKVALERFEKLSEKLRFDQPDVLQNKLPEDITNLFSKIEI